MKQKTIIIISISILVSFYVGYRMGISGLKPTPDSINPTPSITPIFIQTPKSEPAESLEETPSATGTAMPTVSTSPVPSVAFVKVISEKPTEGAGTGSYTFSFVKCTDSHCDHYLLPSSKTSQFPILSTTKSEMPFSYLISTNITNIGAAAGSTYLEMSSATEIYLGTIFNGTRNDLGDGKTYYSFTAGLGGEWSTSRVYLLDTAKASSLLKSLLIDSRKGKTAYIESKVAGGDTAAGTAYYYMTSGITVYFK